MPRSARSEYLVISGSLRPESNSRKMAEVLVKEYRSLGVSTELLDLRETPLPLCDGESAYADPQLPGLAEKIAGARVVVIAAPIYNFDVNAAVKNLIELTGKAWEDKIVGFLCAAGGTSSYMSVMGVANSLMLDFRSVIVPRFVYATYTDFQDGQLVSEKVRDRIGQLAASSIKIQNG